MDFVEAVSDAGGDRFVPEAERIAVFDNDGTLWSEQPMYFQLAFSLDRMQAMSPDHPEWKQQQPYKAALEGDLESIMAGGEHALLQLVMATHAGMSTDEFEQVVKDWVSTARHPISGKLYTEMVYQPMLELLDFLRANGFKTYVVSGGGIDFIRPWAERVYGIPPEQVIGSSIKTKFAFREGVPEIIRLPEIDFIDDKEGKPVGIQRHIGRRPIAAFGNSNGDLQMLQWTAAGPGARLAVIVHHTDAAREWAYDRDSHIGRLDKALLEAKQKNWTVVDMKNDWISVFSWQESLP
jgi:phosphoglycolate phosphatase-like HAD superfamily hydrolase